MKESLSEFPLNKSLSKFPNSTEVGDEMSNDFFLLS